MAVSLHVAAHPDELVSLLCDQLLAPVGDPFTAEVVAVPTRGIERWLTQTIATEMARRGVGDGICANVDFPPPGRLVQSALRAVPELAASSDAWEGAALTAHLLEAIDAHLDEPWLALLARHLDRPDGANRLPAAEKISRLFASYARRRPQMVRAWADGVDAGPGGGPLPERDAWQARLWRAVRERIGAPSLPELIPEALAPLATGSVSLDLPRRFSIYGLTAADPLDLAVLIALGERRQVDLYLLHPSPALWRETTAGIAAGSPLPLRHHDPAAARPVHPLLQSWAQDSREMQVVLAALGLGAEPVDPAPRPATLLGRIQEGILHNRWPPDAGEVVGADRSVQIHVCHGPRRQVEVLRDAVLHVLAGDPTLEPRDVVIMTPDLATFAPLIEAAFPRSGAPDGIPDLRVRIADRSPAATNPLVRFAATVLDLADGRLQGAAVRDLVARPLVQRRFGFDVDTAGLIDEVIAGANIAWGLDGDHRRQWGAGSDACRTWARGLDRAVTGIFYSDSAVHVVGDTVPLEGVEGQEARPVAILAAIVDRIGAIRRLLGGGLPLSSWAGALEACVRMLAAPDWDEEWQWDQLRRLLAESFPAATGADPQIGVAEARSVLARWIDDRPSPLHFNTGDVTVCTLVPMRSVPYRVVCLLGMDDHRFPRGSRADGDDLLLGHEIVGDHDRGAEDRQLLLDAVMAAGDHLIVTYSGHDELTNAEYPPATPIAELRDTVTRMLGVSDPGPPLITAHPLQSFSERNFTPGALGVDGPWGFDPMQYAGAEARRQGGPEGSPTVAWPPPDEDGPISLATLVRFFENPARRFLYHRLGLTVPDLGEAPDDNLSADLGPLQRWAVTDRILEGLAAGHPIDALTRRERFSDAIPPGLLGVDDLERSAETASALWEAARQRGYDPAAMRPVAGMVTAAGRAVEGSVLADSATGQLVTVTASTIKGKHRLRAYAELLFVTAAAPEVAWKSLVIGRGGQGNKVVTIGPVPGAAAEDRRRGALERLGTLVELYGEGLREPMTLPCETGFAWERHRRGDEGRALKEAADAFTGRYGEAGNTYHQLVAPSVTSLALLREQTRFEEYCERLWLPVLLLSRESRA